MQLRSTLFVLALATFLPACQTAGSSEPLHDHSGPIVTREVVYQADGQALHGYLASPADTNADHPGVLVLHEWWGHNDYARSRAEQLAELGYVALAVDMYGDGRQANHPDDAMAFMQATMSDPAAVAARFDAALDVLGDAPGVDPERTAAIGYCMGGGMSLAMARRGVDLDAVVVFHGGLGTEMPAGPNTDLPRILVLTGADDPFVPTQQIKAFEAEMATAGAEYEVVAYPGTVHAFTNPGATAVGADHGLPLRYNPEADADSWRRMRELFAEVF